MQAHQTFEARETRPERRPLGPVALIRSLQVPPAWAVRDAASGLVTGVFALVWPKVSDGPAAATHPPPLRYGGLPKRLIDILLVLLSVPFILPVVGLLLLLVARDGHPPIYRQKRVGRGGRIYEMLKIRTMVPDADNRLAAHLAANPEARAEWEVHQKLKNDPRVTRLGCILRKSSLDELPQLWNVLRGDMSLVGPRPMMPDQARLYPGEAYYRLRPGITGAWQVSDRNNSSFADRAGFDDAYDARLTAVTDIVILFRTVIVVLRGTGY